MSNSKMLVTEMISHVIESAIVTCQCMGLEEGSGMRLPAIILIQYTLSRE